MKTSQVCWASRALANKRSSRGFTLIEVMIVVAIVGILAAIALPSYNDYIRRGQLPEAFSSLSDFRTKMEQYYQDNRNYGSDDECASDTSAQAWNSFTATERFTYACALTNSGQGYTITATGASGRATGHEYTIDHRGNRGTTSFKGEDSTATCWLTSSSSC